METPLGLASGTGGKPLGTERLSVLPTLVQASDGSSGQAFAREVERAIERFRGDGPEKKRLEAHEGERRDARRAGFGRERPGATESEREVRPVEAVFRSEQAPVATQPAAVPPPSVDETVQASSPDPLPACGAPAGAPPNDAPEAPPPSDAPSAPGATPAPAAVAGGESRSTFEPPASAGARSNEAQPVDLPPPVRASGKTAKPAAAPAPSGPDPALLERVGEILRQIQLHATQDVRRLTLDLEPAELGRLSVQLALRAGKVAAIVRGENPETLELLEQRESELLHVLGRRGIAAESVRFELGFRGSRSKRSSPPAAAGAPSASLHKDSSGAPRDIAARIDLVA